MTVTRSWGGWQVGWYHKEHSVLKKSIVACLRSARFLCLQCLRWWHWLRPWLPHVGATFCGLRQEEQDLLHSFSAEKGMAVLHVKAVSCSLGSGWRPNARSDVQGLVLPASRHSSRGTVQHRVHGPKLFSSVCRFVVAGVCGWGLRLRSWHVFSQLFPGCACILCLNTQM